MLTKEELEEKQWLNVCMAEGKFVDKNYALRGYDIYGKPLKAKDMKFEKGKWYKFSTSVGEYITRFFKEENNIFVTDTGHLLNKKYRVDNSNGNITDIKNNQFTEISLEEIQQYLPDDHPDKFKSENLWDKLKVGDYLYVLEGLLEKEPHKQYYVGDIIRITKIRDDKYGKWITHEPDSFSGGGFRWVEKDNAYILDKHFRKATADEVASITSKEEYKVGDWVTHITNWTDPCDGLKTYQIKRINGGFIYVDWKACPNANDFISNFRKATPQEIEQAKSGWKVPTKEDLSNILKQYSLTSEDSVCTGKGILIQVSSKPKLKLKSKNKVKISKKHVQVSNKHLI